jgi:hypothetical protein
MTRFWRGFEIRLNVSVVAAISQPRVSKAPLIPEQTVFDRLQLSTLRSPAGGTISPGRPLVAEFGRLDCPDRRLPAGRYQPAPRKGLSLVSEPFP